MGEQSLRQHYERRYDVLVLLLVSFVALGVALSLPFMRISQLVFWHDEYTLFTSIKGMWESGHYILACVIFLFSIIFPFAKLIVLTVIWFKKMEVEARDKALHWLGVLGKWSMLDVFVIAVLIVLTQSKGYVDAEPRAGLFVFGGAILLSMFLSLWIEHLAKKVE